MPDSCVAEVVGRVLLHTITWGLMPESPTAVPPGTSWTCRKTDKLKGNTLIVKCFSLEVIIIISIHSLETRTDHVPQGCVLGQEMHREEHVAHSTSTEYLCL